MKAFSPVSQMRLLFHLDILEILHLFQQYNNTFACSHYSDVGEWSHDIQVNKIKKYNCFALYLDCFHLKTIDLISHFCSFIINPCTFPIFTSFRKKINKVSIIATITKSMIHNTATKYLQFQYEHVLSHSKLFYPHSFYSSILFVLCMSVFISP